MYSYSCDFLYIHKFSCDFTYLEKRKRMSAVKNFGASKRTGKTEESPGPGGGLPAEAASGSPGHG